MIGRLTIHVSCFLSVLKSFSVISFTALNTYLFTFPGEMLFYVCYPVMSNLEVISYQCFSLFTNL